MIFFNLEKKESNNHYVINNRGKDALPPVIKVWFLLVKYLFWFTPGKNEKFLQKKKLFFYDLLGGFKKKNYREYDL